MSFLEERYLSVTMAQMAAADIFHALQRHSSADPYLDFYAQILSGTIEVSCARTLRLIRDKVCAVVRVAGAQHRNSPPAPSIPPSIPDPHHWPVGTRA